MSLPASLHIPLCLVTWYLLDTSMPYPMPGTGDTKGEKHIGTQHMFWCQQPGRALEWTLNWGWHLDGQKDKGHP